MAPAKTVSYCGEELTIVELANRLKMSCQGVRYRLKKGLPLANGEIIKPHITYCKKLASFEAWSNKLDELIKEEQLATTRNIISEWLAEKASHEINSKHQRKTQTKNV